LLRQIFTRRPILTLTARGSEDDKVKGLESAADDYLPPIPRLFAQLQTTFGRYVLKLNRLDISVRQDISQTERVLATNACLAASCGICSSSSAPGERRTFRRDSHS